MTKTCFNCGKKGTNIYGYTICDSCKSKLKLFSDETIKKHYLKNPEKFSKEIQRRLGFIDKDYIKKRIKLLHVQEQLKHL
jgi:hypothetical protein